MLTIAPFISKQYVHNPLIRCWAFDIIFFSFSRESPVLSCFCFVMSQRFFFFSFPLKIDTLLHLKSHMSLIIRFIALCSTNRAPVQLHLPVQLTCISNKQEKQAVVETLQSELVRGARGSRAPQTNTHINGDPLCVFDDGTLSEVSDDEGRYIYSMPSYVSVLPLCH